MTKRLRIGVLYGGVSVEHEVSVITALQVMENLPKEECDVFPIYIAKDGSWLTGTALFNINNYLDLARLVRLAEPVTLSLNPSRKGLRYTGSIWNRWSTGGHMSSFTPLDAIVVATHGGHGEDGSLQGLLNITGLPYTSSGVEASALCMSKVLTKERLREVGLPVLEDVHGPASGFADSASGLIQKVESRFGYPVVVKPGSLGSSIAVSRVSAREELALAAATVATYDPIAIVESAQDSALEVNCSVIGGADQLAKASACEQVERSGILTYVDKYAGGAKLASTKSSSGVTSNSHRSRNIPAPLSPSLTDLVRGTAVQAFEALGCFGVIRVDMFVEPTSSSVFVNEVNTVPGSLSYYLWEPAGLSFREMLKELIELAQRRAELEGRITRSIEPWLLSSASKSPKGLGKA